MAPINRIWNYDQSVSTYIKQILLPTYAIEHII